MTFSERQQADNEFEKIKHCIKETSLFYVLEETPFSAKICLRKKLLKDFSSPVPLSPFETICDANKNFVKTDQNCPTNISKTVVELNKQIVQLKESNQNKDKIIVKIQDALKKVDSQKDDFKKEREVKISQLKHANKLLDTTKANMEKLAVEHENMKKTHSNKTIKLEKKLENLGGELEQKSIELKNEKRKVRADLKNLKKENEKNKKEITFLNETLEKLNNDLKIFERIKTTPPAPKATPTTISTATTSLTTTTTTSSSTPTTFSSTLPFSSSSKSPIVSCTSLTSSTFSSHSFTTTMPTATPMLSTVAVSVLPEEERECFLTMTEEDKNDFAQMCRKAFYKTVENEHSNLLESDDGNFDGVKKWALGQRKGKH